MKSPIQLFIAIAVLLAAATVTAQVYKWVDKDGKVQYSDIPPQPDAKNAPPKTLDTRSAAGPAAPAKAPPANAKDAPKDGKASGKDSGKAGPQSLADRTKDADKRRAEEAAAAKKSADEEQFNKANQARCKDATRYLAELDSGRPIGSSDDSGNRKLLDDEARKVETTRARSAMSESCK
ncbi:MAG: DUF4124 domain-containing protein [Pseudomonadota bacterium]